MQSTHLMVAGLVLAGLGVVFAPRHGADASAPPPASSAPAANGHHVLVVEGDRDGLSITHASRKQDPWAGVPQGFTSDWTLSILDANGACLAEVPLDVTKFATGAAQKGQPRQVEGCIVTDSRIAILVNAPCFDAAATYTFARGKVAIGTVAAATVQQLAGGGR